MKKGAIFSYAIHYIKVLSPDVAQCEKVFIKHDDTNTYLSIGSKAIRRNYIFPNLLRTTSEFTG